MRQKGEQFKPIRATLTFHLFVPAKKVGKCEKLKHKLRSYRKIRDCVTHIT